MDDDVLNLTLVNHWIDQVMSAIKIRYGDEVSEKRVQKYLEKLIQKKFKSPKLYLVNNYRRKIVASDLANLAEVIYSQNLIMGGAGAIFVPHAMIKNPLIGYIISRMDLRKHYKKERGKYEKGTPMWLMNDIAQGNTKIALNSLYGVTGYAKFILYNIFLAQAVTTMGKNIIATAACGFENFLADNIRFDEPSELIEYIQNICEEYKGKYENQMDLTMIGVVKSDEEVVERLLKKCGFTIPYAVRHHVEEIVSRCSPGEKLMLYFKNNFLEFNRVSMIKEKIMYIIANTPELKLPDIGKIPSQEVQDAVNDLWKFYDAFVFYNYPIYDKVRKMSYGTREAVLYIDTDSNFISLMKWIMQVRDEFFHGDFTQVSRDEFIYVCVNIITIFLNFVVDRNLKMLCAEMQVAPEWRKYLSMKNEFFFKRILFSDVKKRYIDLMMVQEGQLLYHTGPNGEKIPGDPEIKGFDFRKAVTKDTVREFYTDICLNDILMADKIDIRTIMHKINDFKKELERSMRAGESKYFKQANVAIPSHYANPYQIQGVKGVMLWNALCPEYAIELPSDVDIVPIKDLSKKKNQEWFKEHYPDYYEKLQYNILNNRNPAIANMSLNTLAKPKNDTIQLPPWFKDLLDADAVIDTALSLFHPIMESLGPKVLRASSTKQHMTNIVDL